MTKQAPRVKRGAFSFAVVVNVRTVFAIVVFRQAILVFAVWAQGSRRPLRQLRCCPFLQLPLTIRNKNAYFTHTKK
jgi:hypothetical protein